MLGGKSELLLQLAFNSGARMLSWFHMTPGR
jgi:hypothetical protein